MSRHITPNQHIKILQEMKDHLIQTADHLLAKLNGLPVNVRTQFQEEIGELEVAVFKTRGEY